MTLSPIPHALRTHAIFPSLPQACALRAYYWPNKLFCCFLTLRRHTQFFVPCAREPRKPSWTPSPMVTISHKKDPGAHAGVWDVLSYRRPQALVNWDLEANSHTSHPEVNKASEDGRSRGVNPTVWEDCSQWVQPPSWVLRAHKELRWNELAASLRCLAVPKPWAGLDQHEEPLLGNQSQRIQPLRGPRKTQYYCQGYAEVVRYLDCFFTSPADSTASSPADHHSFAKVTSTSYL